MVLILQYFMIAFEDGNNEETSLNALKNGQTWPRLRKWIVKCFIDYLFWKCKIKLSLTIL